MLNLSMPGSQTRESDLTTFTIMVDGEVLPDTVSIVAIDIRKEINRIPTASVILYDGDAAKHVNIDLESIISCTTG